jgi:alpha-glucosidase
MRKVLLLATACLIATTCFGQKRAVDAEGHAWWQHAVFYEIYPRSFADSNNDGIGDLNGISSQLDYLKSLGVDAIWITPCFPSPQVDFGYDVSDYENIDPQYGTLADFQRLTTQADKRGIRIILDFVINHTSDKHKWFEESRASRENPKRDWYVWRNGKGPDQPPNNWISTFGGPAWKFDPPTGQFYYHYFYPEQPDLNWRNPAVENAMFDVTRWWYQRGVAGFRLDAVDTLFEDPDLRDNPLKPGVNKYGDPNEDNVYNTRLPQVHDVLKRLRKVADGYDAVLIGETWTKNIDELREYYGERGDELQMPMDLLLTDMKKLSAADIRSHVAAVDSAGGWPVYVLSNHDIVRHYTRYGDGVHNDQIAKLVAAFYLTLRGTPIMYYGEEIGMENNDPKSREEVKDPKGRTGWPRDKGRDGERTPMQWNTSKNAGFSTVEPWLPVPASFATHNVAIEEKDRNSILNWYKSLLKLRHTDPALLEGKWVALNEADQNVLVYLRQYKDQAVVVALNMSGEKQTVRLDLGPQGFAAASLITLLASSSTPSKVANEITLGPFDTYIGRVQPQRTNPR